MTISLSDLAALRVLANEMLRTIDRMETGEGQGVNRIVVSGAKRSKTGGTDNSPPGSGDGAVSKGGPPPNPQDNVEAARKQEPASKEQTDLIKALLIERELPEEQEEKVRARLANGLSLFEAHKALDWLGTFPVRPEFADRPF